MIEDTQPHQSGSEQRYQRTRQVHAPQFRADDLPTQPAPPVYAEAPLEAPAPIQGGRQRRARRRERRWLRTISPRAVAVGMIAGLSVFALLGVLIVVGAYVYFQALELVLPGVSVGQVSLGGMSRREAAAALDEAWNGSEQGLIISDGAQNWYAPAAEFGLALDPRITAQRAYDVGHGAPIVAEVKTFFETTLRGRNVAPVVSFDEAQARMGLEAWAPKLTLPAQDASIVIDEDGQVSAVPGEPGYTLNVEGTLQVLAADPGLAVMDGYLPLVLDPIAPRIVDASAAVEEARALLDAPLAIRAYDPVADETLEWTAEPDVIAVWLTVQTLEDGSHAVVDGERVGDYLTDLNASLGGLRYLDAQAAASEITVALRESRPAALFVRHHPTSYIVQPGDTLTSVAWEVGIPYWRIKEANPGLDENSLTVGQTLIIPSKDDLLPLPVVVGKRIVVDISEQHLWAYANGSEVYSFVISTGIDRSPTQPGIFQVQDHDLSVYAPQWDLTMPHFISIYEAWPGFFNGFHGLPTLSGGQLLWREVLGRPASYGCIILDLDDGETLYNWAEDGVVVEIRE